MTTVPAIFSRCFPLASAPLPPVSSSQQFVIWVNPILSTTLFLDWGFGEKSSHTWEKFRFFLINGLSVVTQIIYFKFSFMKVKGLCLTSFFSRFCMYVAFFSQHYLLKRWSLLHGAASVLCPASTSLGLGSLCTMATNYHRRGHVFAGLTVLKAGTQRWVGRYQKDLHRS